MRYWRLRLTLWLRKKKKKRRRKIKLLTAAMSTSDTGEAASNGAAVASSGDDDSLSESNFNWKETTSLLMKELDNLGRSQPSPSNFQQQQHQQQQPAIGGVAVAQANAHPTQNHNSRFHHQHHPQQQRRLSSSSSPLATVATAAAASSSLTGEEVEQFALHQDAVVGAPPQSQSVARAILQAVKTRVRHQKAHTLTGGPKRVDYPIVAKTSKSAITNGHATEEELRRLQIISGSEAKVTTNNNNGSAVIDRNSATARQTPSPHLPSSSSTTAAAAAKQRKNRFHLDLKSSHISLLRRRARTPPAAGRPSLRQKPSSAGSPDLESKFSTAGGGGAGPFVADGTPAGNSAEEEEEHGLIAFNSALLQVTPSTSAATVVVGGHPTTSTYAVGDDDGGVRPQWTKVRLPAVGGGSTSSSAAAAVVSMESADEGDEDLEQRQMRRNGGGAIRSESPENDRPIGVVADSVESGESCRLSLHDGPGAAVAATANYPTCCVAGPSSPTSEAFLHSRNRFCTSYRLKVPDLKNPVDICALPNRCLAIADYDNGFVVLNRNGDIVKHCIVLDEKNACGVVSCVLADELTLLVLAYKEGSWSIVCFSSSFDFTEAVACPEDGQIETWALRKLAVGEDGVLYLMATGESKSVIWSYEFASASWKMLVTENSRRGQYNDFAVRYDAATRETHFLLCDWKKSQLSSVVVTETEELAGVQTIKMKRVKGQEWIVQGPKLACWDEDSDIVLYDGSGKVFWFDGQRFKFKRIVADVGKGEVGALAVRDGWCFALCRYRLCVEAVLYKELPETTL